MFFYAPGPWWAAGGSLRSTRQASACPHSQGRCCWRTLQIAVYQTFNQNQSYGFHNSENV